MMGDQGARSKDAGLRQLYRVSLHRRHRLDQPALLQEGRKPAIAPLVERRRAEGKARNRVFPSAPVQFVVQLAAIPDEKSPALVRMIDQILDPPLECVDEGAVRRTVDLGLVRDQD